MNKNQVAQVLNEIGTLMELKGENPFKARAYYNGARTIETLDEDLGRLVSSGRIKDLKGIGPALAEKITELVETGDLQYFRDLKASIPGGLLEMLRIPGLGPKKIYRLYESLAVSEIAELAYACRENRLVALKGFGTKSQESILRGIEHVKKFQGLFLYCDAAPRAQDLSEKLARCDQVLELEIAGSLRRRKEVVKDIDIVASTGAPEKVTEFFKNLEPVAEVVSSGRTKTSVILDSGIGADLRLVAPEAFACALHHFTGSSEHNTALRRRAKKAGCKINEYGLFKAESRLPVESEERLFALLGLAFIPPELRENAGEIEAAEQGRIPRLVSRPDLQGVFHVHTNYSDGAHTLEEMVAEARLAGFAYMGISDHSRSAAYAGGLSIDRVRRQHEEILLFNETHPGFYVFHGIESDILADGSLDYPENVLALFDFVIASVHSGFAHTGEAATRRLIAAMANPFVTMLGHPTGRLLLGRPGYAPDMEKIIAAARKYRVVIELNASPQRLDIDWRHLRHAREQGVLISINPDAHSREGLHDVQYGVNTARKGWLENKDVFNTQTAEQVRSYLDGKKNI